MGDWRKSTYSDATGGNCVEVASDAAVRVRDTTQLDGVSLEFSTRAWETFLAANR